MLMKSESMLSPVVSPHGGSVFGRQRLQMRFESQLKVREDLTRRLVSYQGNKATPGLRWMKYKEGFSSELVENLIGDTHSKRVLDPFAGLCTTPLVAAGLGLTGIGIEIMPIGVLAGNAIASAANCISAVEFEREASTLLKRIESSRKPRKKDTFRHVRITEGAFPRETEQDLAKAKSHISELGESPIATLLNLACMSVLEEISYTRKDGQYLRWDHRCNRRLKGHMNKGDIYSLSDALRVKLREMSEDFEPLKIKFGFGSPKLITASCLDTLQTMPTASIDTVITSPPYANRYDYTRTYALELAWLGYEQNHFASLRQDLLSSTVENKSKMAWLRKAYGDSKLLDHAIKIFSEQDAISETIETLERTKNELANPNIIRLIEGYFLEMAIVIAELSRIVVPDGTVYMVNDNVQYHGEGVPVDLILSDFAEQSGFECDSIWLLARGKGNSSQQMGRFGRTEIRKCLYKWVRKS